jgi:hypothetical protein
MYTCGLLKKYSLKVAFFALPVSVMPNIPHYKAISDSNFVSRHLAFVFLAFT